MSSLITIVSKDFEFPDGITETQLIHALEKAFDYLIREDFNKLLQILYRADVDQDRLKKILAAETEKSQAFIIAETYLERQKAKVAIWEKYSQK